jgi:hypothetical protein
MLTDPPESRACGILARAGAIAFVVFVSLRAVQIRLIPGAEFVVPEGSDFSPN